MLELDRSLTDFNYYYFYLLQYLQLNKYHVDPDHPQIISNSIATLDAFENARRSGANVPMAEAEAISVLFSNIGASEYDTISELILENFGDTIDLDSEEAVEYWTNQVMTDIPDLFDGVDRMAIGVDALDLELMEAEIVGRIVIYLSDNGLQ